MKKQVKSRKNRKDIFVIQISDDYLKIIKFHQYSLNKREAADFDYVKLDEGIKDKELTKKAKSIFEKLGYSNNPVILSLPRSQATCRYIKIPAKSSEEIEKIIPFQASKYLPYPAQDLVTGYQVISSDKQGYSYVNLNIAHKDIVSGYIAFLESLNIKNFSIILSSYGLRNLYNEIKTKTDETDMIVEIGENYTELVVIAGNEFIFSRSFKLARQPDLENVLLEEIGKTSTAYTKETGQPAPKRIIVLAPENISKEKLSANLSFSLEFPNYYEKFIAQPLTGKIFSAGNSISGIIGLGLKDLDSTLNILPQAIRQSHLRAFKKREFIKSLAIALVTIFILGSAVLKDLSNKKNYAIKLKGELNKISKDAKTLEELERRFSILESQAKYRLNVLEMFHELHKMVPSDIHFSSFVYEDNKQVSLRGQTSVLDNILKLVAGLENSDFFTDFACKLRYATKKKTQAGDVIDFEIVCLRKK